MMIALAGAMSTAELGVSLAEMIRQDKVAIISCTGANLEEDLMNLVAHSHYEQVPHYRDLRPKMSAHSLTVDSIGDRYLYFGRRSLQETTGPF